MPRRHFEPPPGKQIRKQAWQAWQIQKQYQWIRPTELAIWSWPINTTTNVTNGFQVQITSST